MNSSTCYQFSLSVKKWKKKNFLRKNEIFANEGLYYRFFVTLKPILYWSMRYQFCLSLKIRKKKQFFTKKCDFFIEELIHQVFCFAEVESVLFKVLSGFLVSQKCKKFQQNFLTNWMWIYQFILIFQVYVAIEDFGYPLFQVFFGARFFPLISVQ